MGRIGIRHLLLLGPICGLLSSCLEDINLDTGERILNVYCILKQGSEQELELSYIKPTGGESQPVGDGVTILLYDENIPVGEFTRTSETQWSLDYVPEGGHTYRLEVKVPGEETLTAETRYPPIGQLHTVVAFIPEKTAADGTVKPPARIWGYEIESSEDLILWCYYENLNDGPMITGYIASDHPGVDGRGETRFPLDPESPVYKSRFTFGSSMHYPSGYILPSDVLGEQVFLHEKVLRIMHPAGFSRPFDNEKMKVYHFINKAEGEDLIQPIEDKSGKTGIFCLASVEAPSRKEWVLNSVSAEYDKYMADYYFTRRASYDFTTLVYRKNQYSNIQNGTGIFGASYEYRGLVSDYFYL